jgi:hypothetical protein
MVMGYDPLHVSQLPTLAEHVPSKHLFLPTHPKSLLKSAYI